MDLTAVLAPLARRDTWTAAGYLLLTAPLAVAGLLLVVAGLTLGAATAVVGIGVPVLLATLMLAVALADVDRRLVNASLGGHIAGTPGPGNLRALLTGSRTWRSLAWLVLRGVSGLAVVAAATVAAVVLSALLVMPFVDGYLRWGTLWRSHSGLASAWTPPVALVVALVLLHLARLGGSAHRRAATSLLGPDEAAQVAALQAEAGSLQERAQLARELHDGIGHALTVMVLQAEAVRQVGAPPGDVALRSLAETGRGALADLDRVLVALQPDDVPVLHPAPTLAALPDLVDRAREAGLTVTTEVTPVDAAAAHPAGAVAYRIVQEACTNALRHAGGAPTEVRVLVVRSGWLEISVRTAPPRPGPTAAASLPPPPAGGRGLAGLAERVRLAGGEWSAGPDPQGGWRVTARLPGPGSTAP